MTRCAFNGNETLTFSDYLDVDTGRTLTAEPGGVYDVARAGGSGPDVPSPWFTPLEGRGPEVAAEVPAEVPEEQPEPPAGQGEPQQPEEPEQF